MSRPDKPGKPEILAPAGGAAMLRAAVFAGADAVYLGLLQLNARRGAANFAPDALRDAVRFCHARGVRVHVTLNTTLFPGELAGAAEALSQIADAGADAVIVQDLAAAVLAARIAPSLALHGSTQMSVQSLDGVKQLADMGFSRVILARELTLGEIERIASQSPIETEVFIHGALCVSVSGQCYMSAFLGGRSGNRGACAGPCRLPFDADEKARAARGCHLSLRDLCGLRFLPRLAQAGVASVKIEGRLRTPEYAAAVVDAALRARNGEDYDEKILRDVFSRSGFTDGYLTGRRGGEMFGVRTGEDAAAARAAAPGLRGLYRRERARVGVSLSLALSARGASLTAWDDAQRTARAVKEGPLAPGEKPPAEAEAAYRRSLAKTGGTPFYAREIEVTGAQWHLAGGAVNELRRAALEALLEKRGAPCPLPRADDKEALRALLAGAPAAWEFPGGGYAAHFDHAAAAPLDDLADAAALSFPLREWREVPPALRAKTWLFAPRALFGGAEEAARRDAEACRAEGFAGIAAQNIAHFKTFADMPLAGAFGLNVANAPAAREYARLGARALTLSPELPLADCTRVARDAPVPLLALAYGHMPLMLTRACPLRNVRDCAGCGGAGSLLDRKGLRFPVRCSGPEGARVVYNPIPLWWGDRRAALGPVAPLLYFTIESPERARAVLALFRAGKPFDGAFTRGLA